MIEVEIQGDREIVARFETLSPKVHLRVVKALHAVVARLEAYVKGGKLTGQALHVRTGALRRSIGGVVTESGDTIEGRVGIFGGPTLPYGRAHEFGFEGIVTVKEHLRHIKKQTGSFGRGEKRFATGVTTVRAHTAHLRIPERSFLRSALAELGPAATQVIADAVNEAVHA